MCKRSYPFILVCLLLMTFPGCGSSEPETDTSGADVAALGRQARDLSKKIENVQQKVRKLLAELVVEITEGDIDTAVEAARVEQTIEDVREMRREIQKSITPIEGPIT